MKPSIRASELDRIIACPGSLTLSRIVDARDGDEGFEGVMLHWMSADRLIREHGAVAPDGGLPPPEVPAGYQLPANSLWIVDWFVRVVLEHVPPTWTLMVELSFVHEYGRWTNTGHADVTALSPDGTESIGFDLKTGRDPVDPAECNWQCADYTCLTVLDWPTIKKATFKICQPRLNEDDGHERVSSVTLEGERLERLSETIDRHVCATLDAPMVLDTGMKSCNWCPATLQCPARIKELEAMKHTMTDYELAGVERKPNDMVLGDWLITAKMCTRPFADAKDMAKERIAAQGKIVASDGTVITQKISKGAYKVDRPVEMWNTVKGLISEEGMALCASFSMTELKDRIAQEHGIPVSGKSGSTATDIFDAQIRTHVSQGEKSTLVFT